MFSVEPHYKILDHVIWGAKWRGKILGQSDLPILRQISAQAQPPYWRQHWSQSGWHERNHSRLCLLISYHTALLLNSLAESTWSMMTKLSTHPGSAVDQCIGESSLIPSVGRRQYSSDKTSSGCEPISWRRDIITQQLRRHLNMVFQLHEPSILSKLISFGHVFRQYQQLSCSESKNSICSRLIWNMDRKIRAISYRCQGIVLPDGPN